MTTTATTTADALAPIAAKLRAGGELDGDDLHALADLVLDHGLKRLSPERLATLREHGLFAKLQERFREALIKAWEQETCD